jgi:DNA-binding response OmpR family regulator
LARVVVLATDLMLASRVTTSLGAEGHQVEQRSALPDDARALRRSDPFYDGVDLVVADLDAVDPERLSDLGVPVIGFHQHTDVETKRRAEAAGIDLVVPRSRMVRELPELAARLLDA